MRLVAEKLTVERGGRTVIAGLSLAVAAGEALLLTGPNGAGKTTLLRAVAGFIRPLSGRLLLEGGSAEHSVGEQCHFVGHQNAVKPSLTVAENLGFWRAYLGGESDGAGTDVAAALDRLGLSDLAAVRAGYLSAGQRRRLALARLLVGHRPLWLLDEPTVSLDAASGAAFASVVAGHVASGGLVVAATHVPLGIGSARSLELGGQAAAA